MTEEMVQLGYRELAERLGISPDAARMKAKRAAKSGRWRIIPGNHPSDRVLIEIPAAELNAPERVGGEQSERIGRRTPDQTEGNAITAQMVAALQLAQERIRELTDQLTEEKDCHRETAIALAQAEGVQANAVLEIDRLQMTIAQLQDEIQTERRSWWQRIWGSSIK